MVAHLWSSPQRRHHGLCCDQTGRLTSQHANISNLGNALLAEEHIGALEVTVHHGWALAVQVVETKGYIERDLAAQPLPSHHAAVLAQRRVQVAPLCIKSSSSSSSS